MLLTRIKCTIRASYSERPGLNPLTFAHHVPLTTRPAPVARALSANVKDWTHQGRRVQR